VSNRSGSSSPPCMRALPGPKSPWSTLVQIMPRLRVLGPVEAEGDGKRTDLGGPRQLAVLALLLTGRCDIVSVDRMIDRLWRTEPPPRATASLQASVSNLRRALEPGRARRALPRCWSVPRPGTRSGCRRTPWTPCGAAAGADRVTGLHLLPCPSVRGATRYGVRSAAGRTLAGRAARPARSPL